MAIFVTSDLHGYPLSKFKRHLKEAGFTNDDWLYILGDVVDRNGDGGVEMLKWLLEQPNVQLLRGNHEQMMLDCSWAFLEIDEESIEDLSPEKIEALNNWYFNGGETTMTAMRRLLHDFPEIAEDVLEYLRETPLCEAIEVGGRQFVLCHAGFGGFRENKKLSEYTAQELLWNRPLEEDRYFENALTIIGHTPTNYYWCPGKAFHTDTWIDIDVGGAMGKPPMLLRLDDMKEFYFDN